MISMVNHGYSLFCANVILDCINPDMTVNKSPDTITLMDFFILINTSIFSKYS